jgi:hypothetical protein
MNRRDLLVFSSAALLTHEGIARAEETTTTAMPAAIAKILLKYSRAKASYKVPKKDTKLDKYVGSLSSALALTIDQQKAASGIFLNAISSRANIMTQIKEARHNLSNAVMANDAAGISQISAAIGNLEVQRITTGANAHSAFYQLLTTDQQSRLMQFRT